MRYVLFALLALGLTACYSEDDFNADFAEAACAKATECEQSIIDYYVNDLGLDETTAADSAKMVTDAWCGSTDTEEGEDTDTETTEESTCEFNKDNAQQCVDDIEAATCEQSAMGWTLPEICGQTCE